MRMEERPSIRPTHPYLGRADAETAFFRRSPCDALMLQLHDLMKADAPLRERLTGEPMRVLLVKTSSMGDVIHALPVVSDLRANLPGVEIDWMVEEALAGLPGLHPGVRRVLPLGWRRWRRNLAKPATWREMRRFIATLRAETYDRVLDAQGLVKSALWACQARGDLTGYDGRSAWEPLASLVYSTRVSLPRDLHAVERMRRLAASGLGYADPVAAPDFGIHLSDVEVAWSPPPGGSVLVPNAGRRQKLWEEGRWIALGRLLAERGSSPVVLWGSVAEQERAGRIARGCGGRVPPALGLIEIASIMTRCRLVVGLDTGLSHLAAALGVPAIGIFCDSEPSQAGLSGPGWSRSVGGCGRQPDLEEVRALVIEALAQGRERSRS